MSDLVWVDELPPSAREVAARARRDLNVIEKVEAVRKHPGKWLVMREVSRNNITRALQRLRRQYPDCEFEARSAQGVSTVYARLKEPANLSR